MNVTDLPIWNDCRYRTQVPSGVEIRRGVVAGVDTVVLWDPVNELHVDIAHKHLSRRGIVKLLVSNLTRATNYVRDGGHILAAGESLPAA